METASILPPSLDRVRSGKRPRLRLQLAVLESAVRDFQRHLRADDDRGQRLFRNAAQWFASDNRLEPYAFESVCGALGIDPELVRSNLTRWQATQFVREARQWLDHRRPAQG